MRILLREFLISLDRIWLDRNLRWGCLKETSHKPTSDGLMCRRCGHYLKP